MITLGSGTIDYQVTPPLLVGTPSGTGGSIAAGTYIYTATVTTAAGESLQGKETTVTTTGTTSKVDFTFEWPIGATALKIYRKPSAGSYGIITTINYNATPVVVYADIAANTTAGTPPATGAAWTTLGEIDGDAELDLAFESKVFRGQSAFARSKAFHSGKAGLKCKKVEFKGEHLRNLLGLSFVRTGSNDIYTLGQTSRPILTSLRFTHTRSDVSNKTITITANNVTSDAFAVPFPKEDFVMNDVEFELMADASNNVAAITIQV